MSVSNTHCGAPMRPAVGEDGTSHAACIPRRASLSLLLRLLLLGVLGALALSPASATMVACGDGGYR